MVMENPWSMETVSSDTFVCVCVLSRVRLFATPRTVAHQAPLSMELSSQNTRVGCHFLLQGIFLNQGSNPCPLHWQADP